MKTLLINLILSACLNNTSIYELDNTPMVCIDYYNNCVHNIAERYYSDPSDNEVARYFKACEKAAKVVK